VFTYGKEGGEEGGSQEEEVILRIFTVSQTPPGSSPGLFYIRIQLINNGSATYGER
jgi:hypothetical protein